MKRKIIPLEKRKKEDRRVATRRNADLLKKMIKGCFDEELREITHPKWPPSDDYAGKCRRLGEINDQIYNESQKFSAVIGKLTALRNALLLSIYAPDAPPAKRERERERA